MGMHLVQSTLVALQIGLLQHRLAQRHVIQLLVTEQLRNQVPEMVDKVRVGGLGGEAGAADTHCLQHPATPQLVQHVVVLKQHRPATVC